MRLALSTFAAFPIALIAAIFVAVMPFAVLGDPAADAGQLAAVLKSLRAVNAAYIVAWSADPLPPRTTSDAVSALKAKILSLEAADRSALLFWLRAHGRDALHQRGATDLEIGPPLYPIDYEIAWTRLPEGFVNPTPLPTATPPPSASPSNRANPRGIFGFISQLALPKLTTGGQVASHSSSESHMEGSTLVTTTNSSSVSVHAGVDTAALVGMLAQAAASSAGRETAPRPAPPQKRWLLLDFGKERVDHEASGIGVDHGVGGIRNNTEAAACISFANRNARAVREIDFDLTFVDARNHALQTMPLRRSGLLAPNAESTAPHDLNAGDVAREHANCTTMGHSNVGAPSIASLSRASALAYAVRRVLFEDGTAWQRPGANAWPTVIK